MGIIYGRRNFISSDIIYYNIKRNNPNLENYFQHRSYRRGIDIQTFRRIKCRIYKWNIFFIFL